MGMCLTYDAVLFWINASELAGINMSENKMGSDYKDPSNTAQAAQSAGQKGAKDAASSMASIDGLSEKEFAKKTQVNLARPHLPFLAALFKFRFSDMSIIHRLYMCVGLTFFLFLVATLVVFFMTQSESLGKDSRTGMRQVLKVSNQITGDIITFEDSIRDLITKEVSGVTAENSVNEAIRSIEQNVSKLESLTPSIADEQLKESLHNKYVPSLKRHTETMGAAARTILGAYQHDTQTAAKTAFEQTSSCSMPALYELRQLITTLNNKSSAMQVAADRTMRWIQYSLFIGLGIALFVIILTNITIRRSLRHDTGLLLKNLMSMARGDLSVKVGLEARDEIGSIARLVDFVSLNTNGTLSLVKSDIDKLHNMVSTNLRSIDATNDAITIQRNTAQSVAEATSEMEVAVEKVTEFARSTLDEVKSAEEASDTCRRTMQDNITTTHTLSDRLHASSEALNKIHMMSSQIEAIVKTIADIADQTNLLALNATIESARAGESGRGFAIVADEVRELAIRTAKSTKEVSKTISSLEAAVTNSVDVMASCESEMANSLQQSSRANSSIEEIMGIIATISDMSEQIVMSCQQQTSSAAEINSSIAHISKLAEDSYEQMSELSHNMNQLGDLATNQAEVIGKFKLKDQK